MEVYSEHDCLQTPKNQEVILIKPGEKFKLSNTTLLQALRRYSINFSEALHLQISLYLQKCHGKLKIIAKLRELGG